MTIRLNLNPWFFFWILAFVSFLDSSSTLAQDSKVDKSEKTTKSLWSKIDKLDRKDLITLTRLHIEKNEPEEALKAINLLLGKKETDFEAHTLRGNALSLQKKSSLAMESYKKAVELNAQYEPAYRGLIELYEKRTPPNYYELRILYQDLIDNIGPRHQYLTKLCEVNVQDNIYEAAISACESAIQKNKSSAEPYVLLGISLRATGDEAKGLKHLKTAAKKFPTSEFAQYSYASALEEKKDFLSARNYFKAGTIADPKAGRSWVGLARIAFELQKYDESVEAFKTACRLDKKNAPAFRKAAATLRSGSSSEWASTFTNFADQCTNSY